MTVYRAWMTGDRITDESASEGMPAESGWVDPAWSLSSLEESRNYVRPAAEYDPSDPDDVESFPTVAAWIAATVSEHLGAAEDNGDGTFYASDAVTLDYSTGDTFTYALHFEVKRYDSRRGWVEIPVTADGATLDGFARR